MGLPGNPISGRHSRGAGKPGGSYRAVGEEHAAHPAKAESQGDLGRPPR